VTSDNLVSLADVEYSMLDAHGAGSPDSVIERILAAVDDPALRADDFETPLALVAVADLQDRFGRKEQALATLRRADAEGHRSDTMEPKARIAALLVDLGRFDEAAAVFADVHQRGLGDWASYELYGEHLERAGDLPGALAILQAGEERARHHGDTFGLAELAKPIARISMALELSAGEGSLPQPTALSD
jgi:tetratricopeptide (TPR) repeat protein